MSFEIDARIWFAEGKEVDAGIRFHELVNSIAGADAISDAWLNFGVKMPRQNSKLLHIGTDIEVGSLAEIASQFSGKDVQFRIYVPMHAWRFSSMTAEDAYVQMGVTVWSLPYLESYRLDPDLHGHAQISVLDAGPFFELTNPEVLAHKNAADINRKTEENADRFIKLLLHVSQSVPIEKMMVYTDLCEYLPFNAHMAYFSDRELLLDEVNRMIPTLNEGAGSIPPLVEVDAKVEKHFFHELRPPEARKELFDRLRKLSEDDRKVRKEDLDIVLGSGEFDFFENGEAIMLLDYPSFANSFLDRFFLDLLEQRQKSLTT